MVLRDRHVAVCRFQQLISIDEFQRVRVIAQIRIPERERTRFDVRHVIRVRPPERESDSARTTGADSSKVMSRPIDKREITVLVLQMFKNFQTPFVRLAVAAPVFGAGRHHCGSVYIIP